MQSPNLNRLLQVRGGRVLGCGVGWGCGCWGACSRPLAPCAAGPWPAWRGALPGRWRASWRRKRAVAVMGGFMRAAGHGRRIGRRPCGAAAAHVVAAHVSPFLPTLSSAAGPLWQLCHPKRADSLLGPAAQARSRGVAVKCCPCPPASRASRLHRSIIAALPTHLCFFATSSAPTHSHSPHLIPPPPPPSPFPLPPRSNLVDAIRPHLPALRGTPHGKRILAKVSIKL